MKALLLTLLLILPALGEEVRIRRDPAQSRVVVRDGVIFCPLQSLSQELGTDLRAAGEGYCVGDFVAPVPAFKVSVNGKLLDLQEEGGEPIVNAEEFCKALGGRVTQPERGVLGLYPPLAKAGPVNRNDPASFFISQSRSSSNPTGSIDNSNCGPASLAMAARAFGKWPLEIAENDYPSMMTWIRRAMGHKTDEMQGTNTPWLTKAADKLGLPNQLFLKFDELPGHLARGQLVVIAGYMKDLNMPGDSHAMLVVGQRGDDFLVNDPGLFYKLPASPIHSADLKRFFVCGIAVGPPEGPKRSVPPL
ncbi:MAG: C39 family peptidase [Candidatus Eremiobacteraeota bacterium]|nr:C39 family peptidase [Candidatus Eremiobacteraeota bacterium]